VAGLIGPVQGLRIADIGCGTGRYAVRLAEAGGHVTGVDFSSGMLEVLRVKEVTGSLEIVEYDLTAGVPLNSEVFDLVLCCLVLEHLPDIDHMLEELYRICKRGGHILITDFHPEMIRRGFHARFHEASTDAKYQINGAYRPVAGYVMSVLRAGLRIEHISEHIIDEEVARGSESAQKWVGLPFLLVLKLART